MGLRSATSLACALLPSAHRVEVDPNRWDHLRDGHSAERVASSPRVASTSLFGSVPPILNSVMILDLTDQLATPRTATGELEVPRDGPVHDSAHENNARHLCQESATKCGMSGRQTRAELPKTSKRIDTRQKRQTVELPHGQKLIHPHTIAHPRCHAITCTIEFRPLSYSPINSLT